MDLKNSIILGDCLEILRQIPNDTFHAVVTDVPYGLGQREPTPREILAFISGEKMKTGDFMGNDWDIPSVKIWKEVYRVLKPGGHVLSFGGCRTFDLISLGLRMAGFENRDTIADNFPGFMWTYGSGMPKSHNVSKALTKKVGKDIIEEEDIPPEAKLWRGFGTGLKPSWEPILVFRKPFAGTVVSNVLKHGTGALNINPCRVRHSNKEDFEQHKAQVDAVKAKGGVRGNSWKNASDLSGASDVTEDGRWPANLVLTHAKYTWYHFREDLPEDIRLGLMFAYASPLLHSGTRLQGEILEVEESFILPEWTHFFEFSSSEECQVVGTYKVDAPVINRFDDGAKPFGHGAGHPYTSIQTGDFEGKEEVTIWECTSGCPVEQFKNSDPRDYIGASKYFKQFQAGVDSPSRYVPKPNKTETSLDGRMTNNHPCRKPLDLMRWLVRLVTFKGAHILDPYCGSGSTLHAAMEEGVFYTGIENDPASYEIAVKRMSIVSGDDRERQSQMDAFDLAMQLGSDDDS
jgi:DNA modification methylase